MNFFFCNPVRSSAYHTAHSDLDTRGTLLFWEEVETPKVGMALHIHLVQPPWRSTAFPVHQLRPNQIAIPRGCVALRQHTRLDQGIISLAVSGVTSRRSRRAPALRVPGRPTPRPGRRQGTLVGWVSLATTCSAHFVLLTFRVSGRRGPSTLSPFPLPFPHPLGSRPPGPEAKMAAVDAGAASAELVIGWCIFGLLLLVGEALGVYPMFRPVGEREAPALQRASPGRGDPPRPAPPRF